MKIAFKLSAALLKTALTDLRRPHVFAGERVGFLICRPTRLRDGGLLIIAHAFAGVADADYVDDPPAVVTMGSDAIRKALQTAYSQRASMFHLHIHEHPGRPNFSTTDRRETTRFVPDFWNVQPALPHGAIVLSQDSAFGKCWIPGEKEPAAISEFVSVGIPMRKL